MEETKKTDLTEMTEKELLVELVKDGRRRSRMTAVTMCAMLITAAALMYAAFTVVPSAVGTMEEMNASMQQLSATMTGIDKMVGNVNTLVEDNMDAVTESLGKVQAIDIDKLNESIAHMSDVLEPLANISNFFGGKS